MRARPWVLIIYSAHHQKVEFFYSKQRKILIFIRFFGTIKYKHLTRRVIMLVAKGQTYNAKNFLKACVMSWNSIDKVWSCEKNSFDNDQWVKNCSPTYNGPRNAGYCRAVEIIEK